MLKTNSLGNSYIKLNPTTDNNNSNLNIEFIQNDYRFAKLINTLLFELYPNNLDWNVDKTKMGIIGIYPINDISNWSILNYFGGHKYVKNTILSEYLLTTGEKTISSFYDWVINNKERIFLSGEILQKLIKTNFNTLNKGSRTELFVIDKLKNTNYTLKYYPPGSKYDRDYGIDLEINEKSFQIKEMIGIVNTNGKIYCKTPLPKNYLGKGVERIMLVNLNNGDYISFENNDYEIDITNSQYIISESVKRKVGNLNDI